VIKNKRSETEILLNYIADGRFHSGKLLAELLNVSMTAVWKQMKKLEQFGLGVQAVRGKGYRLSQPLQLLQAENIWPRISDEKRDGIENMEIFFETDSTNKHLMKRLQTEDIHRNIVLAEFQTAGKGRRGKQWVSPLASGICMSIGWHFDPRPEALTALSLAYGVIVVRAMKAMGYKSIKLKWPNDIVHNDRKLGGILIESRAETAGPCDVVIGMGLNIDLSKRVIGSIDQATVTDLATISSNQATRNTIAGTLIEESLSGIEEVSNNGYSAFIDEWRSHDSLYGKQVNLILPNSSYIGKAKGVNNNGMLTMLINGKTKLFASGETTLRVLN